MRVMPIQHIYKQTNKPKGKTMTPEELKALRAKLGLTQEQLAQKLHITRGHVTKMEAGTFGIGGGVLAALEMLANSIPQK